LILDIHTRERIDFHDGPKFTEGGTPG
jgi:hypothetical protein